MRAEDVRLYTAVGAPLVPLAAHARRHVENDGDRRHAMATREREPLQTSLRVNVRGVDDREPPAPKPEIGDVMQRVERVVGRRLAVLVVCDEAAEEVGRKDFTGLEVPRGERRLARAGRPHEDDERRPGNHEDLMVLQVHVSRMGQPHARCAISR